MDMADEHDPWPSTSITSRGTTCLSVLEKYAIKAVEMCVNAQSTDFATFPMDTTEQPAQPASDINSRILREQNMRARLVHTSDTKRNA